MRSRSSRLFIVLLSLVGVSTNLPKKHGSHRGIVGVHPMAILLERLYLEDFEDGLDGLLRQAGVAAQDLLLEEPYWLQDESDGRCFTPAGFSECGDATLWHIRQRPQWKRGLLRRLLMADELEEKDWGYALQLVDTNEDDSPLQQSQDCLVRRRRRANTEVGLGKCTSLETAWSWRVSGEGILFHGGGKRLLPSQCLWRTNGTIPILSSCEADEEDSSSRLVRFSLVRYHTSSKSATVERALEEEYRQEEETRIKKEEMRRQQEQEKEKQQAGDHHVKSVDLAHVHATEPLVHTNLKPPSHLMFTPVGIGGASLSSRQASQAPRTHILKAASPILLAQDHRRDTVPVPTAPPLVENKRSAPVKLRKMPTHPYIAAAKNNVWTDPQTGLEFKTDLCEYLGHDRRESGRHTLTGVGQYMRTVFNIKIYGVGLYVSKRDVLADPLFEPFSTLTQDELRERSDFYTHLRQMPSPLDDRGGLFDRTLFLKLNMQLSTETMRSSLQGDWKMLTEESKTLLTDSSLKPRPADANMLRTIQSEENPGNCSCGQVAPEEYGADASCCARGTELVFTWRKNGDLEIRVDGRIMDTFARPDIASGIFYDYLRDDDPISVDFVHNVVEGFPFLLAPLSQVKGVSSGSMASSSSSNTDGRQEHRAFVRALSSFTGMVTSRTEDLSEWLHGNANAMAKGMQTAVQTAGDSARNFGEEMDRRREQMMRQAESSIHFVASRIHPPSRRAMAAMPSWMKGLGSKVIGDDDDEFNIEDVQQKHHGRKPAPRGRAFGSPLTRWLGEESLEATLPDEIGPMIHPTMNLTRKVFLAMVHLYLMLLLIVSMPGTNTRTKLVVRRKRQGRDQCKDGNLKGRNAAARTKVKAKPNPDECPGGGKIKKSFSYFV